MNKTWKPAKVKFCPSPLYNNKAPLGGGIVKDAIESIRINDDMWRSKPVGFTPVEITEEMKTQEIYGGRIISSRTSTRRRKSNQRRLYQPGRSLRTITRCYPINT